MSSPSISPPRPNRPSKIVTATHFSASSSSAAASSSSSSSFASISAVQHSSSASAVSSLCQSSVVDPPPPSCDPPPPPPPPRPFQINLISPLTAPSPLSISPRCASSPESVSAPATSALSPVLTLPRTVSAIESVFSDFAKQQKQLRQIEVQPVLDENFRLKLELQSMFVRLMFFVCSNLLCFGSRYQASGRNVVAAADFAISIQFVSAKGTVAVCDSAAGESAQTEKLRTADCVSTCGSAGARYQSVL